MIPIARPVLDEAEVDAVRRVILSGWVTQGPAVAAFERAFASYVGAPYACAVSSCTAALHLALLAAGVCSGDEVITVSHSFIATANAVRYCGAVPVFVDIEPATYNIDPRLIEPAITRRTRAILCVHQMGMPCDLAAIMPLARRHGLSVVEDAACAVGSEIAMDGTWQKIGKPHGDVACFSFHPRKLLTTGDGGMLTTSNREWDQKFRLWRQHGMSVPDTIRHGASEVIFERYPFLGYNYRMTDIQAAIGSVQLGRLDTLLPRRRALAARYRELMAVSTLQTPYEPPWARSNWQSYCVRLPDSAEQRKIMQTLLDAGVSTRRGIMCAHREDTYREYPLRFSLIESERAQDSALLLPLLEQMTDEDLMTVVRVLEQTCCGAT
jgi:dTDP-4-amino-4,6-dideoxygalactose transaminase